MKEKQAFKRGTIGYAANKLAKKYGHYSQGIYILCSALEQALSREASEGKEEVNFYVNGICDNPVHQEMMAKEQEILDRCLAEIKESRKV